MEKISDKSKKGIEKFLKEEIKKSGFPHEIKTALILKKNGWEVTPHIYYFEEKKLAKRYLETGEKLETLGILLHHLRKAYPNLKSDMKLVEKLLE